MKEIKAVIKAVLCPIIFLPSDIQIVLLIVYGILPDKY